MTRKTIDYKDSEIRKTFIGGSDAAAILGLSRWKTPLQVWAEKTGQITPEDISGKLNVKLGIRLEDAVADLFCEATGFKVRRVNETLFSDEHEFLAANIDRRVVGDDSILECKTTSAFNAKAWEGEEIPQEYIIQCLHYLAVTGMSKAYIAVLIGNQDFKWKIIERDEKTISAIIDQEVKFWNEFIVPVVMPTRIMAADSWILNSLFPEQQPNTTIPLTDEILKKVELRTSIIADMDNLEKQKNQIENEIRAFLGDNEGGEASVAGRITKATWKAQRVAPFIDNEKLKFDGIYQKYELMNFKRVLRITTKEGKG